MFRIGDRLNDVQNQHLKGSFKLTRVGVTEVKKPVVVTRPDKAVSLTAIFNLFVDLPAELKGSHLSRNLEVLSEVLDEVVRRPVTSLESLCAKICKELLERHEYATCSEVNMSADYFLERAVNGGVGGLENYLLRASARAFRDGRIRTSIGVEVVGMTACPCAMEVIRGLLKEQNPGLNENLDGIPMLTHNQRNVTGLMLEVSGDFGIEAEELIDIVERSLSSPTYEILKRENEAKVVLNAHSNPKFVEDVVRDILREVLDKCRDMPDDVVIHVKSESQESIHKHNAFAERITTLGELRE